MNLNGKWSGYYEYGSGYFLPFFGEKVEFEIIFNLEDELKFNGNIHEKPSQFSVPIDAHVKGFINENLISFIKSYDVRPEITEDGNAIIIKEGVLEVAFTGYLDKDNDCIYGVWDIEDPITENGEVIMDYLSGIWMIKKEV